jgi:hypothetical protein
MVEFRFIDRINHRKKAPIDQQGAHGLGRQVEVL